MGDLDVDQAIETIKQKFGNLTPKLDTQKVLKDSGKSEWVRVQ